jgi:mannosyl-oligosaccharide alpha-1,2-mannosidase
MRGIRRWVLCSGLAVLLLITFYHVTHRSPALEGQYPRSQDATKTNFAASHQKWSERPIRYPVTSLLSIPTGSPVAIPRVQFDFLNEDAKSKATRETRLNFVKEAFIHSWKGYKRHAWLKDEVAPVTGGYRSTFGGWGATLVDALDTLCIMGMTEEFEEAVAAVSEIDFATVDELPINIFETTIRYLGGLLGAYDTSHGKYPVLLEKSIEVGEMLYAAFDTPNRMPITRWNAGTDPSQTEALERSLVAEIGSLSLEFTRLSQLSGDSKYFDAVQRIMDLFDQQQNQTKLPGMWPVLVNAKTGDFSRDTFFTVGGMADSLYEYLPKV